MHQSLFLERELESGIGPSSERGGHRIHNLLREERRLRMSWRVRWAPAAALLPKLLEHQALHTATF
jgi:hypothetical protein